MNGLANSRPWMLCLSCGARIASFIADAQTILKNKIFGYKQGETGLLEVLDAQRTYNEVLLSFYDTLFRAMKAQIELDRAVGI